MMNTHKQKTSVVSRINRNTYGKDWRNQSDTVKIRDKHTCGHCKRPRSKLKDGEYLEVHHIVPLSRGGVNSGLNLHTLCSTCHKKIHRHL